MKLQKVFEALDEALKSKDLLITSYFEENNRLREIVRDLENKLQGRDAPCEK